MPNTSRSELFSVPPEMVIALLVMSPGLKTTDCQSVSVDLNNGLPPTNSTGITLSSMGTPFSVRHSYVYLADSWAGSVPSLTAACHSARPYSSVLHTSSLRVNH